MNSHVRLASLSLFCIFALGADAATTLRVLKAGPAGEIASLAEANEIRVVFSEPMIALGRIPDKLDVPFFRITPAIPGTFRWSGTTTLIFTPDPKKPLPHATRYEVVIDASAASLSGNTLPRSHVFSFTTPTVRLLSTTWYRKSGRFDDPVVIGLRFNQSIDASAVSAHLKLANSPHSWTRPTLSASTRAVLQKADPAAITQFDAKVSRIEGVVKSSAPVFAFVPDSWDKERFPPGRDLLVLETRPGVSTDSWIRVVIDPSVPSTEGSAVPGKLQEFVIRLEPTLFVDGFNCARECDPERYNPLVFRSAIDIGSARTEITASDVSKSAAGQPLTRVNRDEGAASRFDSQPRITLEDLGYPIVPASTIRVDVDPSLTASDGQTLGYRWIGDVEHWHRSAFTSFGDGHGVWEASGGAQLPFYARNMRDVSQWVKPLAEDELVPTILRLQEKGFQEAPAGTPQIRKLAPVPDKIQSYGIDISNALPARGFGLLHAAVRDGQRIPRSHPAWDAREPRSSLIQVTNLGISVKDSPENVLVLVTTLDEGTPVAGATVTIRAKDNRIAWRGTTDSDGIAIGPKNELRLQLPERMEGEEEIATPDPDEPEYDPWYQSWGFLFVVTAEKDGDFAYVGSDWTEGIEPWYFGLQYDVTEAKDLLRGELFTDRGVYRLGEEVHLKAILRSDTPGGMQLLPSGTVVTLTLQDSQSKRIQRRTLTLNEWSSAEWTFRLPADGALGNWTVSARVAGQRNTLFGNFLVSAYRRPDFRVDVTLTGRSGIAGDDLDGSITGRYLFGGLMAGMPLRWTLYRTPVYSAPAEVTEKFPGQRFVFVGYDWTGDQPMERETVASNEATLDARGAHTRALPTNLDAGSPHQYTFEGEVTDVSRQRIANRASTLVHPAPWYIGLSSPSYFTDVAKGIEMSVVAVTPEGLVTPGVPVTVTLQQIQWNSVRRAEGNGFYTWETERKEVPSGSWNVTTETSPVNLQIPVPRGGFYVLRARAEDGKGRSTSTVTSFYALGAGYTAWQRYDHNRIDFVPEKKTYKPGETARIMIQSPWETATALLTTEREGVRSHRRFELTSTQQTVSVPITEEHIPNFYVSILLIKGRTKAGGDDDGSDPGKPAFRIGYTELRVEDSSKRLDVTVTANKEEYRPATDAVVNVAVRDHTGAGARSEVTLWAVDYGVLSLTAYQTPDILDSIYVPKALQVMNQDSRQRIISRRVLTPKGASEGGGGGDPGDAVRRDFRVLAFWIGSVVTDANGNASTTIKLPESLTTYRIMAVAGDKVSRFGQAESEIRINKPVLLRPTFPRFLAMGDQAVFGAVVNSQLKRRGRAVVTIRSLDPAVLDFSGETSQRVQIPAGGSSEVRFNATTRSVGEARVQMTVRLLGESDAFEDVIPVRILVSPETVAAYGETAGEAREALDIPSDVVPSFGGLRIEMASTAMVGLGEGARYLLDYPYGCAEQRASRGLALMLAADLGEAFNLPGIVPGKAKEVAALNLKELEKFQCPSGGFAFWPGNCFTVSPYLTSYVLHVLQRGQALGYDVTADVMERAYVYLEQQLAATPPVNESWWPSYTAWQAFSVKVLTEGGRNQDSNINRLYGYLDRMPVFAISFLYDALTAKGEKGARITEVERRINNAILAEGGASHVEELNDPYLLLFWNSNVRSTAIVLGSLVRNSNDTTLIRGLVRWLMNARERGRWGNTQENAWAMGSLVDYYRKYESEVPDFTASALLGEQTLATSTFKGRSTDAETENVPMTRILAAAPAGTRVDLTMRKEGTGTLFYIASFRYAVDRLFQSGLDNGFQVERMYSPHKTSEPATSFAAGDLVTITLRIRNTKERRWVAVTDPLPAGFEAVESLFATTATDLAEEQQQAEQGADWTSWFRSGGFDRVERHDDRVNLFATRLSEGVHEFSYVARATTSGTFRTAPAHAEEMYQPEIFGRTATNVIEVKK